MPTRIIRDALLGSERYWSVSIEARELYVHILLTADDFGCVSLAPFYIKRMCFEAPPSDRRLTRYLAELVDEDLIRRYEFQGAVFGFVPRFRQRLQRMTLKHPMPPESLYQDDKDALEKFSRIKMLTKNPTVGQPLGNRSPTDGQPPEVEVEGNKKRSRSEERPKSKAWINPVEVQKPDPDDTLTLKAQQAGLQQRDGETRGQFALRVAQASTSTATAPEEPRAKGKFED